MRAATGPPLSRIVNRSLAGTMPDFPPPDLDVVNVGSIAAEISPIRLGLRIDESDSLVLYAGGSATIFVLSLARLGGRIGFIARVGDDQLGRWLLQTLRTAGVDTEAIARVGGQLTPLSLASVDEAGNKAFVFYRFPGTCDPLATLRAAEIDDAYLARGRVFDLAEGSLRDATLRRESMALARRARALGRTICFNPNFRAGSWAGGAAKAKAALGEALTLADLAIMNEAEAMLLSGADTAADATAWFQRHGPALTVVTSGSQPTLVIDGGTVHTVPAFAVDVVYDVGAGDVFHAGFLAAWRPGADPLPAARFAAAAAAIKIGRPPQSEHLPTRAEVLAFLDEGVGGGGGGGGGMGAGGGGVGAGDG
jgi:sugar/nucleoside kinase (ribokinase family)